MKRGGRTISMTGRNTVAYRSVRTRIGASLLLLTVMLAHAAAVLAAPAAPIRLRWELEPGTALAPAPTGSSRALFTVTNSAHDPLPAQGWALYFTCLAGIDTGAVPGGLAIERVLGTLFRLRPTTAFTGLAPGETLQLRVVHPDAMFNPAKVPLGPYLVFDKAPETALPISDYEIAPIPAGAGMRTPQETYARNAAIAVVPGESLPPVFPTPRQFERRPGSLRWTTMPEVIAAARLRTEAAVARAMLAPYLAAPSAATRAARLHLAIARIAGQAAPEAYELTIDPLGGVTLLGNSTAGVARGLASLSQLLPPRPSADHTVELHALFISDAPRFAYRGLMLDVARNFQPKAAVLQLLDLMARYKLNVFHFHLSDDEGWRLEIAGLPELTSVGGRRGHTLQQAGYLPPAYGSGPDINNAYGSGYYRRADYLEILRYAAARHIEVIPEIEMPGHARAALVSMAARARRLESEGRADADRFLLSDRRDASVYQSAQLYTDNVMNPGLPSTYAFIEHVVAELVALHQAAGVPLRTIHVGGDELAAGAWERSPACQALMRRERLGSSADLWDYFYARVDQLLRRHGLYASGWEELGTRAATLDGKEKMLPNPHFSHSGFTLYVWRNIDAAEDMAYRLANAGYDTVLTPASRLYFDLTPYPSADEPGQDWAGNVDLDTVFNYVPLDDIRVAPDDPTRLAGREGLTDFGRQHIRGLEGTLFTETVHDPGRMEYMLMPRLLALAERAWAAEPAWTQQGDHAHAAPLHAAAWATFVSQLGLQVLPRLDVQFPGLHYRIPPPGLARVNGAVLANEQIPGFSLRYTVDGSEPIVSSPLVAGPIYDPGRVRVAAFNGNGDQSRSAQPVDRN